MYLITLMYGVISVANWVSLLFKKCAFLDDRFSLAPRRDMPYCSGMIHEVSKQVWYSEAQNA